MTDIAKTDELFFARTGMDRTRVSRITEEALAGADDGELFLEYTQSEGITFDDGGRYDPASNSWRFISTANAPVARESHTASWTGTQMIVWGGLAEYPVTFDDGAAYVHFHQDANFNVTLLTDSAGNEVEYYQYSPYGQLTVYDADYRPLAQSTVAPHSSTMATYDSLDSGQPEPAPCEI